jgi:hypothetical protein
MSSNFNLSQVVGLVTKYTELVESQDFKKIKTKLLSMDQTSMPVASLSRSTRWPVNLSDFPIIMRK